MTQRLTPSYPTKISFVLPMIQGFTVFEHIARQPFIFFRPMTDPSDKISLFWPTTLASTNFLMKISSLLFSVSTGPGLGCSQEGNSAASFGTYRRS